MLRAARSVVSSLAVVAALLLVAASPENASAQTLPTCAGPPVVAFDSLSRSIPPNFEEAFGFEDTFAASDAEVPGPIAVEMLDRGGRPFFRGITKADERSDNSWSVSLDRGDRWVWIVAKYTEVAADGTHCARTIVRQVNEMPLRLTIQARPSGITALGRFRPRSDPTYAAAIRAFGEPSSERRYRGSSCRVRWGLIGLRIEFANFGGYDACDPDKGRAQSAVVRGQRARSWRTRRGLRIGTSARSIRRRHPSAKRRKRSWWIVTGHRKFGPSCNGGPCPFPVLTARTARGKVSSLYFWIGSAGE